MDDFQRHPVQNHLINSITTGGGEMGALMRALDWSKTPLGSAETWPQSLRTAVSIALASRFPMLIWWGADMVKLYNDAYRPMLGAKHPASLGARGRDVWPEIWPIIGPMLEGVLQRGEATWSNDQLLLLDRSGYLEECYFTFSYSPISDETGGVGGIFTAVTETTHQVLSTRRLAILSELAANPADAKTPEAACQFAATSLAAHPLDIPFALLYLLSADGQFARLTSATKIEPDQPASPLRIDLATIEDAIWPLADVIRAGEPILIEQLTERFNTLPTGAWGVPPEQAFILPLMRANQELPYGFLVSAINPRRRLDEDYRGFLTLVAGQIATAIANARAYEEERQRAEALATLNNAKTLFFSNVSHELRTPLTLMLDPLQAVLNDSQNALTTRQREMLELINRNSLRLLKLVNALLDFSRIEASRAEVAYELTDLAALTTDLASVFRSVIERAGLTFEVDCPPLPEPIYVDREMWEKIVLNLLSNAFKFTFEGSIRVSLRWQGDHVLLEVCDSGIGIAAAELPHLFERFYRVRDARARTYEGTGIGLSLVQELIQLQGGEIEVSSTPGVGTCFMLRLPTAHLNAEQINKRWTQTSTATGILPYIDEAAHWLPDHERPELPLSIETYNTPPITTPISTDNMRILLADDNADMRLYLTRLLTEQGWIVQAYPDGDSALAGALRWQPDLVLSDVMMPGLDGFGLLRALRADSRTRRITIILISARAGEEARLEGLDAGADVYLVKPFSVRELIATVKSHLVLAQVRQDMRQLQTQNTERLQRLAAAALSMNTVLSPGALLDMITQEARELIGVHQAFTSLVIDADWSAALTAVELSEKYGDWRGHVPAADGTGFYGLVCEQNAPLRLSQAELDDYPASERSQSPPLRGLLAAPLTTRDGQNLGLIFLSDKYEGDFTDQDEIILTQLSQMASVALENARLYESLQQSLRTKDEAYALLNTLLESPPVGLAFMDRELRYVHINQTLARLNGHSITDHIGKTLQEMVPLIAGKVEPLMRRVLERGEQILDYELTGRDPILQRQQYYLVSYYPVETEQGERIGVGLVALNVTERRLIERQQAFLIALNDQLRSMADPDEIMWTAASALGRYMGVDRSLYAETDPTQAYTIVNHAYVDGVESSGGLYHMADFGPELIATLRSGETVVIADILQDSRTSSFNAAYSAIGLRAFLCVPLVKEHQLMALFSLHSHQPRHWWPDEIALTEQVAERTWLALEKARAERALRESEARYRNLVELSPDAVFVIIQDQIVYANTATFKLLRVDQPQQLIGQSHFRFISPESAPLAHSRMERLLKTGQANPLVEQRWLRLDQSLFDVEVASTPISWQGEHGVQVIARDITERQLLLKSEQAARLAAERALQARNEFLSVAAHELKTPVTSLRGFSQLLLRQLNKRGTVDPAQLQRALETIDQQSAKLSVLLSQLLDLSRLEAGRLTLNKQTIDMTRFTSDVITAVQRTTSSHALILETPPSLMAAVDPIRLEQVLVNLLENAIKYSPDGGPIEISLRAEPAFMHFAVTDHGIGIPADRRELIFERFYQAHGTGYLGGMGLGLYISRQIVELHNGQIRAEFPAEGGTRFIVSLPLNTTEG